MLHPDVSTEPDAEELFKILNEAYHVLSNPEDRSAYDARIQAHGSDESEHMSYAGYRGTKYQDPSTWYDPYVYDQYNPAQEPDEPIHDTPPDKQNSKKRRLPKFVRHILFYATLLMAIFILTKLIVIPILDNANDTANAQNAIEAYLDGNVWMEEWEYQKAIESYAKAISFRADFAEAWRSKGYVELAKGVELDLELRRPEPARASYLAAIKSLRMAIQYDMEKDSLDLDTVKSLGNAYERLGMWKEAEAVYLEAQKVVPNDLEVRQRLNLIKIYLFGFSNAPPAVPTVAIRSRATMDNSTLSCF